LNPINQEASVVVVVDVVGMWGQGGFLPDTPLTIQLADGERGMIGNCGIYSTEQSSKSGGRAPFITLSGYH